jgi:hypothetical protein
MMTKGMHIAISDPCTIYSIVIAIMILLRQLLLMLLLLLLWVRIACGGGALWWLRNCQTQSIASVTI